MPESDLQVAFGDVMRTLRLAAGLSQEELSFRCGRHRTFVSVVERGKNAPSLTTIWLLADALEVTPSELVRHVELRMGRSDRRRGSDELEALPPRPGE